MKSAVKAVLQLVLFLSLLSPSSAQSINDLKDDDLLERSLVQIRNWGPVRVSALADALATCHKVDTDPCSFALRRLKIMVGVGPVLDLIGVWSISKVTLDNIKDKNAEGEAAQKRLQDIEQRWLYAIQGRLFETDKK